MPDLLRGHRWQSAEALAVIGMLPRRGERRDDDVEDGQGMGEPARCRSGEVAASSWRMVTASTTRGSASTGRPRSVRVTPRSTSTSARSASGVAQLPRGVAVRQAGDRHVESERRPCTKPSQLLRNARKRVCFDGGVINRRLIKASDASWTFGCGLSAVIAITCATAGTFFDIHLVARAQVYCQVDLSSGEKLAEVAWLLSRIVVVPTVSVLSAIASLPFYLLARLPWLAGRVWPVPILLTLTIGVSIAGPVAMVLYDVATEGTPGDCVLPWWPSWLPS
ncbi:hypothetical protein ACQEVF_25820 [Nonomuraea polychroma]|uniref:hypothetical protein n=1 Tax=Nonomuraea polychroma TaxID=46176 RepID=UPI003D95019C